MILIWIFVTPICRVIGASDDTLGYSAQYLRIVAIGIPFLIVGNSFSNIIRAEGHAKTAMMGMIIGNMMNIILDPVMILGFGWNVAGAAVATVIGNIGAALFTVIICFPKIPCFLFIPRIIGQDRGLLRECLP